MAMKSSTVEAAEKPVMVFGINESEHSFYALTWALEHFFVPHAPNLPFKLVIVHAKPPASSFIGLAGPVWNSMISAYSEFRFYDEALNMLSQMQSERVEMNGKTISIWLSICEESATNLGLGKPLHAKLQEQLQEPKGTGVAAFLETCGESLKELSLNNVSGILSLHSKSFLGFMALGIIFIPIGIVSLSASDNLKLLLQCCSPIRNGRFVQRTASLDNNNGYSPVTGRVSSPYLDEYDDDADAFKKKNGNVLRKIDGFWKKPQK